MRIRKTARPSNLPGICSECKDKNQKLYCKGKCRRCYMRLRWRARHRESVIEGARKGSESWIETWLKHQAKNYLRSNAGHFDRNGTRLWAITEEQIIGLCRIIYVAVSKHSSAWHKLPIDKHQKKAWWDRAEGDGSYLDRPISPELRGLTK